MKQEEGGGGGRVKPGGGKGTHLPSWADVYVTVHRKRMHKGYFTENQIICEMNSEVISKNILDRNLVVMATSSLQSELFHFLLPSSITGNSLKTGYLA